MSVAFAGSRAHAEDDSQAQDGFDYYVLVLSWSPTYCATDEAERRDEPHCDRKHGHFTLHGLWPQFFEGWPSDCWRGRRPWVPENVIEEIRDIMPSKGLVIHEYRTHGTCSGLTPEQYFGVARGLYERIVMPETFTAPEDALTLSPEAVEAEFLRANPGLTPEMISVTCRRGALRDVRICFGRDLFPMPCGKNEAASLCRAGEITVSPGAPR